MIEKKGVGNPFEKELVRVWMRIITSLEDKVRKVVEDLGLGLLEFNMGMLRNSVQITLVIYAEGRVVTIDDCALAHSSVLANLDSGDVGGRLKMEVLSPGTERTFKKMDEFRAFVKRDVKYLLVEDESWYTGKVSSVGESSVVLEERGKGLQEIPFSQIRKAKLAPLERER